MRLTWMYPTSTSLGLGVTDSSQSGNRQVVYKASRASSTLALQTQNKMMDRHQRSATSRARERANGYYVCASVRERSPRAPTWQLKGFTIARQEAHTRMPLLLRAERVLRPLPSALWLEPLSAVSSSQLASRNECAGVGRAELPGVGMTGTGPWFATSRSRIRLASRSRPGSQSSQPAPRGVGGGAFTALSTFACGGKTGGRLGGRLTAAASTSSGGALSFFLNHPDQGHERHAVVRLSSGGSCGADDGETWPCAEMIRREICLRTARWDSSSERKPPPRLL